MPEDPKEKLTRWLTEGFSLGDKDKPHSMDFDRTRVVVPGQKEWYQAALSLDDEYWNRRVMLDMKLMMAYKGRRSDDIVTSLASLEKEDAIEAGLQPVKDYMKERRRQQKRVSEP